MSKLTVTATDFRKFEKNTLCGFATIKIAEMRMTIADVAIHERDGKRWAKLPSKPMIKGTEVLTDESGKVKYAPLFSFDDANVRYAFTDGVIRAVEDANYIGTRENA